MSRAPTCIMRWLWPGGICAGIPTPGRSCWSSPTASRPPIWRTLTEAGRLCFLITRRIRARSPTPCGVSTTSRLGAQVTIFRLGSDPGLACFIDQVARGVEGRVVVPDLDGLGAAVVGDYLRSRRRR